MRGSFVMYFIITHNCFYMKKFLFAIFALGFLSPCATANAGSVKTDKPRKVNVKSDT